MMVKKGAQFVLAVLMAAGLPAGSSASASPALGGGSGRLLFMEDGDIYTADLNGGVNRHQLTSDPVRDEFGGRWSPDGSRIVYRVNPSLSGLDGGQVYIMNADGTNQVALTNTAEPNWSPAWSRDGHQIAFASARNGGRMNIWMMSSDGSATRQLTRNWGEYPTWSPDGKRIAFMAFRNHDYNIYSMTATGTKQKRLTSPSGEDGFPDWSPDGRRIVFTSERDGNSDLYLMHADGSHARRLTHTGADESNPVWSPDGRWIAFSFNNESKEGIYIIRADGTGRRRLIAGAVVGADWEPAGGKNARAPAAAAAEKPLPTPTPGVDAVIAAFERHPVVGLGEMHGSVAEHRFIRQLLTDSRFPSSARNVVVEFGSARYQAVIDRYVAGKKVRPTQLRKVWEQTTQTSGVWNAPVYRQFFKTVRSLNAHRPRSKQIRVWLGDPPINWAKIRKCSTPEVDWQRPECIDYWYQRRDSHFAAVINRVVAGGGHALLIAGTAHLARSPGVEPPESVPDLVDAEHPGSVYIVQPYGPFVKPHPEIEDTIRSWPFGSIAAIAGTGLGDVSMADFFGESDERNPLSIGTLSDHFDAMLYLG
jgi:dipeptidyl aminopeptidase/acylaminoacyl peptidase